jgi:integrase/recombinase XerD
MIKPRALSGEVADFIQSKSLGRSPNTIVEYSRTLRRFIERIGPDKLVNSITPKEINNFLLDYPGCKKNQKNAYICLSSFWTYLVNEGYCKENILRRVEKPRAIVRAIIPFSKDEIVRLIKVLDYASESNPSDRAAFIMKRPTAKRDFALVLFLLDTGVRASELCTAKINNIRGEYVQVIGKGSKEREVCMSERTQQVLNEYLTDRQIPGEYIFMGLHGELMDRVALGHLLRRLSVRSKVMGMHPHRFRHTFATEYLRNGGDPYTLQKLLGHSTLTMVMRYLTLARDDISAAHKKASPVLHWGL